MLTTEPTVEMLAEWRELFAIYKNKLFPNEKTPFEVIEYLKNRYPVDQVTDDIYKQVVSDNIINNEYSRKKLPPAGKPHPVVFILKNEGAGKELYNNQGDLFRGTDIVVGIDCETGCFLVEGSVSLWDELFVFRGLDKYDIENAFLVAEYIKCLKKYDPGNELLINR